MLGITSRKSTGLSNNSLKHGSVKKVLDTKTTTLQKHCNVVANSLSSSD